MKASLYTLSPLKLSMKFAILVMSLFGEEGLECALPLRLLGEFYNGIASLLQ
jgi:hypothetical protein